MFEHETDELQIRLEELFRQLHRHPELSWKEYETTALLKELLASLPGVSVHSLGLETGFYAVLEGGRPGPTTALRTDIDALPVTERSGLPYASETKGVMHACGHDFHMCAVTGAAMLLSGHRGEIAGRVVFLYQPAEESSCGAARVIAEELFAREHIDRIFGLHVEPGYPAGGIGLRTGAFSASVDAFAITVSGRGGHGAHPDQCLDPIPAALRLVQSIYEVRSRMLDPTHPAVISVTQVNAGSSYNIIPDSALVGGTVRTLDNHDRTFAREKILEAAGRLESEGYKVEVDWTQGCPASHNDPALIEQIRQTALSLGLSVFPFGPSMGGEDFADYQELVPGALFQVGMGEEISSLHSPTFKADPAWLAQTAQLLAALVI